jgi:hypothetical protein
MLIIHIFFNKKSISLLLYFKKTKNNQNVKNKV